MDYSTFKKNIGVLLSGSVFAQSILIIITPILTRLYEPESFAVLGIFTSVLGVLVVCGCLRYELAIPLADSLDKAAATVMLSFMVLLTVTMATIPLLALFGEHFLQWLNAAENGYILWVIPIGLLLSGSYNILNYWNIKTKEFKPIRNTRITQSISTAILQLCFSIFGGITLVIGQIAGQSTGLLYLYNKTTRSYKNVFNRIEKRDILEAAGSNIKMPLHSLPGGITSSLGQQTPFLLVAFYFDPKLAGFYFMANRIMSLPMTFIGNSISQAFYSEAAAEYKKNRLDKLIRKVVTQLTIIAVFPLLLIAIFGSEIFLFVLGEQWETSGTIAQYLCPIIFFQFITSPVSQTLLVSGNQLLGSVLQLVLLACKLSGIYIGYINSNFELSIILYSAFGSIGYLVFLISSIYYSRNSAYD